LIVIGFFFLLSLILWIIIALRSKCIRLSTKDYYSNVYDGVLFADSEYVEDYNEGVIGPDSLHMRDSDIWSHTHRMYLIGENSVSYPWYLTKDFPNNALNELSKERLLRFINKEQWTLDWSRC